MSSLPEDELIQVPPDPVNDADRLTAIARLHDLVHRGELSLDRFSDRLEQVLAANEHVDLEAAMAALPSVVRLTPASRRLAQPLVVDAGIGRVELGAGWQLAADTTISTQTGKARVDLTAASWDAQEVNLHLRASTGHIDVVIPEGVGIQMVSTTGRVELDRLAPPIPGAPLVRVDAVATSTGRIRLRHHSKRSVRRRRGKK
jgi:hypothetical protein